MVMTIWNQLKMFNENLVSFKCIDNVIYIYEISALKKYVNIFSRIVCKKTLKMVNSIEGYKYIYLFDQLI